MSFRVNEQFEQSGHFTNLLKLDWNYWPVIRFNCLSPIWQVVYVLNLQFFPFFYRWGVSQYYLGWQFTETTVSVINCSSTKPMITSKTRTMAKSHQSVPNLVDQTTLFPKREQKPFIRSFFTISGGHNSWLIVWITRLINILRKGRFQGHQC